MNIRTYTRLFRVPNLLIIILTMVLARYAVVAPFLNASGGGLSTGSLDFILLVFATVTIAAGGYVINDILDVPIDSRNHSQNAVALGLISENKAYYIYYGLNIAGLAAGLFLSLSVGKVQLAIIFLVAATMLYYYSYKYKYLVLWGNLAVAFLSALVPVLVWLFEYFALRNNPAVFVESFRNFRLITLVITAYAAFAFLTTLVRELIKDIEDKEGDRKGGCRTLPIVYGERTAKAWASVFALVTLGTLVFLIAKGWGHGFRPVSVFLIFTVVPMLVFIPLKVLVTPQPDYGKLGNITKVCMVLGVLSMIFIPL